MELFKNRVLWKLCERIHRNIKLSEVIFSECYLCKNVISKNRLISKLRLHFSEISQKCFTEMNLILYLASIAHYVVEWTFSARILEMNLPLLFETKTYQIVLSILLKNYRGGLIFTPATSKIIAPTNVNESDKNSTLRPAGSLNRLCIR